LDWAFRFASAIRSDPIDRGRAQAEVVLTALEAGHLDLARAWADEVTGWRRGVVYAELAVPLAKRGREGEARALLAKAEDMSRRIEDWTGPRVAAHVAAAYAALGDRERSAQISAQLEGEERLKALPVAVAPLVERGEFEAAMEFLGRVTDAHTFDLRRAQLRAYLELARHPALGMQVGKRKQAVAAAIAAARELPVTFQAEAAVEAADLLRGWGNRAEAARLLEEVEAVLVKARDNPLLRAPIVVRVALAWERCGERARCRRLLEEALAGVEEAQDIDQPMVYAAVAGGYAAVRAERQARQMWATGMDLAAALINARPRALAIVELCRTVGAHGLALNAAEQARLRSLYDGLGAPW
jgi:tetratricopeptide (TPR) repeat protein